MPSWYRILVYANYDLIFKSFKFSENSDSLIVSCGYQTTHILPVLNGRVDSMNCRRINLGGANLDGFMQRLLQLKYPGHSAAVSISRAEVTTQLIYRIGHFTVPYVRVYHNELQIVKLGYWIKIKMQFWLQNTNA